MRPRLVIGNRNYSSWSMRAWVLMTELGIGFDELLVKFGDFGADWRARIAPHSPSGQVPVLWLEGEPVWDTLAITETLAERHSGVWPDDARARSMARSACAEMHAGFRALRHAMPMNIRGSYPGCGLTDEVRADIDRIVALWGECRSRFGGDGAMLFGGFSAADAFFAPVVMRFATYAPPLPDHARAYCDAVQRLASVRAWCAAAREESDVIPEEEPYAQR
jgi:glutathione S-transferase